MTVILLCGAAGSGKSTYARRLEDDGWIRLSFDVETWRRGVRSLPAPPEILGEIEDELRVRLVEAVAAGRDVVVDLSFSTRELRDAYRELVANLGIVAGTVHLPVDMSTAVERVRQRRNTGPDDYRLTDEAVRAHVEGFEAPTFAEHPLQVVDGDLALRHACLADVDELLEFWSGSAENASRPQDSEAAVQRLLVRDPAAVIVAELDDRIVGTVIAGWDGWRAHLYRLAVGPEARGRGIARRLMRHAEHRLVDLGATRLDAMVLDGNEAGAAVWRAAGYAPQGEWSRWVKPVGPQEAAAGATVE
ncbi:GNAT family N-acetyltransferase [Aeromicrobium choanae]|uniref:Ribosomal protein S18 acetylase RimI n=1 Tax=Aeromicrobium choanae TaxID=1736691 RepID=A0A1T4Z8U5_9ACTN|nr:GNAT family N-acetyltransferase [Aeromicrobium choanae]SKB10308.1 Ribosomal protein S18 acetylase RimI [Aeromicrobium choanae]